MLVSDKDKALAVQLMAAVIGRVNVEVFFEQKEDATLSPEKIWSRLLTIVASER